MFIEVTRSYRTNMYEHEMLLNVHTIMKVEPCDLAEYGGNTRIVLDRRNTDGDFIVMYVKELYTQVSYRIKVIFNPPNKRKKNARI